MVDNFFLMGIRNSELFCVDWLFVFHVDMVCNYIREPKIEFILSETIMIKKYQLFIFCANVWFRRTI